MTATRDRGAAPRGRPARDVRIEPSPDLEADLPAMWAVADAARRADRELDRNTLDGFRAYYRNLENCDPAADLVVARRDDEILGYARVQWSDTTDGERWYESACFVHPDARRGGLGTRLLAWTEARRAELAAADAAAGAAPERPRWFATFNHDGDVGGGVLLRAAGYEPFRVFHSMLRSTLDDIPAHPLPAGLDIRPIAMDEAAIREVIVADTEAFQDHFGAIDGVETVVRQIVADPDTDTSLWLVAFDGDEIAGAVLNGIRPDHNGLDVGWLDSVFTRRPWRQRGLARALISRSLQLVRARGVASASLGVDAANRNEALALYESCGFAVYSTITAYRKPPPLPESPATEVPR